MSTSNNAMQEVGIVYIVSDHEEGASKGEAKKSCRGSKDDTSQKKKKPQRGMGVAQLERLRMEEGWRKMAERSTFDDHNLHPCQHYCSPHLALMKPILSVPVLHAATNYGVSVLGGVGGRSLLGLDQTATMIQTAANGCGSSHHNPGFTASLSFVETSNKLSSIPKIQPQRALASELSDISSKKEGNNGIDIHGVKQQNNIHFNGGLSAFGAPAARSDYYYASHLDLNHQCVEVMTVHRNGN